MILTGRYQGILLDDDNENVDPTGSNPQLGAIHVVSGNDADITNLRRRASFLAQQPQE
jgi:hypothetical protein